MNQITIIKIGRKTYEKVYECVNGIYNSLPQSNLKIQYQKPIIIDGVYIGWLKNKVSLYTEEMEERSIKIKAAKKIKNQKRVIDFQRTILKNIIDTNNKIEFIVFVCRQLLEYKPKQKTTICLTI